MTRSHSDRLRQSLAPNDHRVDLKRVPPKSRPAAIPKNCSLAKAARKDPAVHVSLSSDSLVKQPGPRGGPLPGWPGEHSKHQTADFSSEAGHRISVRSFGGAPSHRGGGAPCGGYIGRPRSHCQHPVGGFLTGSGRTCYDGSATDIPGVRRAIREGSGKPK